jgi:hypothetical protein
MDIEKPPISLDDALGLWLEKLWKGLLEEDIRTSATWNPGSIADGDEEAIDVTVTGAILGDYAIASFSLDVADLVLDAQVTAADTVTCVLANNTGGAVDLAEGTVYVRLIKRTN